MRLIILMFITVFYFSTSGLANQITYNCKNNLESFSLSKNEGSLSLEWATQNSNKLQLLFNSLMPENSNTPVNVFSFNVSKEESPIFCKERSLPIFTLLQCQVDTYQKKIAGFFNHKQKNSPRFYWSGPALAIETEITERVGPKQFSTELAFQLSFYKYAQSKITFFPQDCTYTDNRSRKP